MIRALLFLLLSATLVSAQRPRVSEDRELTDLDVSTWDCLNQAEGTAKTSDGQERNRMKNRAMPAAIPKPVAALNSAQFLHYVSAFDAQTVHTRRKDLTAAQRQQLGALEQQVVSLTAWLVLAYPGPPETTNCGNGDIHDWHMELFEKPADHAPGMGDPTPIICEITPRTQRAIFRDGIRLQTLMGFFRNPDLSYEPTGHAARQVRVTGHLAWDDEHNGKADIGPRIESVGTNKFHHPWRATAWEIHPVLKVELVDGSPAPPTSLRVKEASSAPAPVPSRESPAAAPVAPTPPPPPQFVTLLQPVKLKVAYGEVTLPSGLKLPLVSRDTTSVVVRYLDGTQRVPIAATDLK